MTTLNHLYITASHDVKATCINFEIKKKLFYPDSFKGRFIYSKLDAIHTPVLNDALYVLYSDGVGEYYVFYGKISKVTPVSHYYDIEATHSLIKAFNYYYTYEWAGATNHDQIMEDLLVTGAGLSTAVHTGVSVHNSIDYYNIENASVIDQLHKLSLCSADGATDKVSVVRCSATSADDVLIEDMGESVPGTDIVISAANGNLLSKVTVDDTSQEIVNKVIMSCGHANETRLITDVDGTSSSIATYGTRILKCYRPEIFSQTNARYGTDTILRQYSEKRSRVKCDVLHSALDGRNYPIINTLYTITEPERGDSYPDLPCIEHTLKWPTFRDTIVCGNTFVSGGDYLLSAQGNANYVEKTTGFKNPYLFKAYRSTSQTIETGAGEIQIFNTESYDIGTGYNTSTGQYTIPATGNYYIEFASQLLVLPNTFTYLAELKRNSSTILNADDYYNNTGSNATATLSGSWSGSLQKGDTVELFVSHDYSGSKSTSTDSTANYLKGKALV